MFDFTKSVVYKIQQTAWHHLVSRPLKSLTPNNDFPIAIHSTANYQKKRSFDGELGN